MTRIAATLDAPLLINLNLEAKDKAIIFHVDMIGEGIDVPGITGIMPFRNCEESKLIQNIGRATRLHPEDRKRLYRDEIGVDDKTQWIKPYTWVIIPSYMIDSEGMESRFRVIIDRLRKEYGFVPQQHTVIDNNTGLDDDTDIDTVNDMVKNKKWTKSGVDSYEHEFEKISLIQRLINEQKKDEMVKGILSTLPQI